MDATPFVPETRSLKTLREAAATSDLAPHVTATIHPAAILRSPDSAAREAEREAFTRDLAAAAAMIEM